MGERSEPIEHEPIEHSVLRAPLPPGPKGGRR